jgi:hypothetical protein
MMVLWDWHNEAEQIQLLSAADSSYFSLVGHHCRPINRIYYHLAATVVNLPIVAL